MKTVVCESRPVTLVGGGTVEEAVFAEALAIAPGIVAADGGADTVLRRGCEPLAVIGDFDSLSPDARAVIPAHKLHRIPEQESTDFEKCLAHTDAPLIVGVGFAGDSRPDHELAALNALVRHPHRRCVLIAHGMVIFLAPPLLSLTLEADSILSLFPLGRVSGRSEGLEWPIDGITFAPDGRVGTSNRAMGEVTLGFDAPGMLILLPRRALAEVCASLLAAPSAWPAP